MGMNIIKYIHCTKTGKKKHKWSLTKAQKVDNQNGYIVYPTNLIGFLGGGVFVF